MSEQPIKGFHWYSRAWYFRLERDLVDSFSIGLYYPSGGCRLEFMIEFKQLSTISARICVFDDAFQAFGEFSELFDALKNRQTAGMLPDQLYQLLVELGYSDLTARSDERHERAMTMRKAALAKLTQEEIQLLGITV